MAKYQQQKQHAPIDDSVKIPAAIRAAAMRSDELHKQVYEAPAEDKPVKEPVAQPVAQQPAPTTEDTDGSTNREQTQAKPEATAAEEKGPNNAKAEVPSEEWQHRYNSMKGRHDTLARQLADANNRIADLERLIANVQSQQAAPQQPPSELTFKPVGAEEREMFGDDFIDIAQRAALEKVSPTVAALTNQINSLQRQIEGVVTQTKHNTTETIYEYLDREIPNWKTINRAPEFLAWVGLPDPYSGATRQKMMLEAFDKGDKTRVLNFFKGFLNDEAATAPALAPKPDLKPAQAQKVPLEQFAAPGRAKAPAADVRTAPGEKETISRSQISQFYMNVQRGAYRGNEAEKNRLEQMIFEAERDGRIVD